MPPFFGVRRALLSVTTRRTFTLPGKFYFASNRTRTPTARAIPTATREFMCSHIDLGVTPYATSDYVAGLPAHYTSATPADNEVAATNAFTIEGVSIGYGATPATATWALLQTVANAALGVAGGQPGTVLDPATNSVGALFRASGLSIPANKKRYLRVAFNVAAGGYVPCGLEQNTNLAEGQLGQATSAAAFLTNGSAVGTGGRLGGSLYSASYVACKGHDGRPSVLSLGDSIHYGKNETGNNFTAGAGGGVVSRAMVDTTASALFLGANLAIPGTGPADIAINGRSKTSRKWDLVARLTALNSGTAPFTHITNNYATNSLGTPYDNTIAFVGMIKAYVGVLNTEWPGIPVAYQGMIPKATTTDGYQTITSQVTAAIDADGNVRWNFNDKLFADKLDGAVQAAINAAQYVSAPGARAKWDVQAGIGTLAHDATASAARYHFDDVSWVQVGDFVSAQPDAGGDGANGSGASVTLVDLTTTPPSIVLNTTIGIALLTGTKFSRHLASDSAGLHPGTTANTRMILAWTAWKNSVWPV